MQRNRNTSSRPALDRSALNGLALHYVGRYATTEAKLARYLLRKIAERGWAGEEAPPIAEIVQYCADSGYVDDRGFAEMRASGLSRRGYGPRRIDQALMGAGIGGEDRAAVIPTLDAFAAADMFARKRRIGPYAAEPANADRACKQIAAMLRAGHDYALARRFVDSAPGDIPDRHK